MSRPAKGARLWLEPEEREEGKLIRRASWVIRDGPHKERTGCAREDRAGAERALADYIASKYQVSRERDRSPAQILVLDVLNVYLAEMYHAPWEARPRAAVFRGLRLMGLSLWLAGTLLLLYFFGSPVSRAALCAEEHWTGALLAGALTVLSLVLAAAAALALLPSGLSIPIALFVAGLAVGAKVFGMGALFLLLGQKLLKNVSPARRPAALAAGFAVLGGVSLVPMAGPLVWSAASVVAVGVAMLSRFGTPRVSVSAR